MRGTRARGRRAGEDRTVTKGEDAAAERADLRLHDAFVGLELRVRPGRTEARDRAVHETGICCAERLVVEAPLLRPARRETDEEDVGLLDHRVHRTAAVFVAQVVHRAVLAPVPDEKARRSARAERVAFGGLDLHDARAVVGEQHPGERRRDAPRADLDDVQALTNRPRHVAPFVRRTTR